MCSVHLFDGPMFVLYLLFTSFLTFQSSFGGTKCKYLIYFANQKIHVFFYTMLRSKIDISFENCIDARAKKKILAHHHFHHRYITSFECVEC